jgi:hypothetical protein
VCTALILSAQSPYPARSVHSHSVDLHCWLHITVNHDGASKHPYTPSVYFIAVLSSRAHLAPFHRATNGKYPFPALFAMTTTNPRERLSYHTQCVFCELNCALSPLSRQVSADASIKRVTGDTNLMSSPLACVHKIQRARRRWFARPHLASKRMHRLSLINNLAGGTYNKILAWPCRAETRAPHTFSIESVQSWCFFFFIVFAWYLMLINSIFAPAVCTSLCPVDVFSKQAAALYIHVICLLIKLRHFK